MTKTPKYRFDAAASQSVYNSWPTPKTIVSDGAYGVGGFPGDPRTSAELTDWYKPHIDAWDKAATLATTLWFWNTEGGWATVHPLLVASGWKFEFLNVWNKGVGHVAGNVNGKTIRRFPVVTEVCAFYTREPVFTDKKTGRSEHLKTWLRDEWRRTGLPMREANQACGVKDAATRKYFDQGWLWYWPPVEVMMQLVSYANENGLEAGKPYFSLDGKNPVTEMEWRETRSTWNHEHGVTNVWDRPALRGSERYTGSFEKSAPRKNSATANSATHLNQKPLDLMERILKASTNPGDVIWEPFGGLASASVAAIKLGRFPCVAEVHAPFADLASERLESATMGKY